MLIVSGKITLKAGRRGEFLAVSREAMAAARGARGCGAFVVAADPLDTDVANVHEESDTEENLLAFRGNGPPTGMRALIASADVRRHRVARSDAA